MLTLLFIALYFSTRYAQPLPITPCMDTRSSDHHCSDPNQCRTVWNIILSCLMTVLSCTWVALHMNIPGPDDLWFTKTTRRIGVMVLALVAPEFIVILAMRQRLAAGRYAKQYQEYGWTRTHGFFAIMGGFALYDDDRFVCTLKPDELGQYLENHEIDITEEEIKVKGKGDILSKGVALVQTGWFILQCIARGVEQLPITELEIATLAFAALNFATYLLWLDKPLDVQCAVPVRRSLSITKDGHVQGGGSFSHRVVGALKSGVKRLPDAIRGLVRKEEIEYVDEISPVGVGDGEVETRVSTFYTGNVQGNEAPDFDTGWACATIFGGIHCIAWFFHFPTPTEQLLWRISSIAITGGVTFPLMLVFICSFILECINLCRNHHRPRIGDVLENPFFSFWFEFVAYILGLAVFLYPFFRLVLLIISFTSLRSLPPVLQYENDFVLHTILASTWPQQQQLALVLSVPPASISLPSLRNHTGRPSYVSKPLHSIPPTSGSNASCF